MIKYLSLFSGIGAFEKALQNLHIPYDLVGYCEIDKYASKAYSMAGNSIVVTVLENLFKQIYKPVTQNIASLKQQSLDILNNI